MPHLVCYAMKANSNLAVLNLLARAGSGFDIVSGGELARALAAGGDPAKMVFSGVGKTAAEMEAALAAGILCFNVESEAELDLLTRSPRSVGKVAPVSFGSIPTSIRARIRTSPRASRKASSASPMPMRRTSIGGAFAMQHVAVHGIGCHIGSQVTELSAYVEAAEKMFVLADRIEADGIALSHIDLGGGLGIRYRDEETIDPYEYALAVGVRAGANAPAAVRAGPFPRRPRRRPADPRPVPQAGRRPRFCGRRRGDERPDPARRCTPHGIPSSRCVPGPIRRAAGRSSGPFARAAISSRTTAISRSCEGDLLAMRAAGAYGFVMSSNYNSRPRACEVVVDGDRAHLVRPRETPSDLFARESTLP